MLSPENNWFMRKENSRFEINCQHISGFISGKHKILA